MRLIAPALIVCGLVLALGLVLGSGAPETNAGAGDTLAVSGQVDVSSRLGSESIAIAGTMTIRTGEPHLDQGVNVIDTEIVAMTLTGESSTGPVTISQNGTTTSLGEIRSLQPPPSQFPASSFIDAFIDVTVQASSFFGPDVITLSNTEALHLVPASGGTEVALDAWPPVGVTFYAEPNPVSDSGLQPQTFPPGEPHCTSGLALMPALPAKACIDVITITIDGVTVVMATPTPTATRIPTPITPKNLQALVVQDQLLIQLFWEDNADNEAGYIVERSVGGADGPWSLIELLPPNTTMYNDNGLTDGVTYWYRVAAEGDAARGSYSNVAFGTATALPTPPAGDADCTFSVTSIDAALVLQFIAGLVSFLSCEEFADADGDGRLTSIDAALILQLVAGLLGDLPP